MRSNPESSLQMTDYSPRDSHRSSSNNSRDRPRDKYSSSSASTSKPKSRWDQKEDSEERDRSSKSSSSRHRDRDSDRNGFSRERDSGYPDRDRRDRDRDDRDTRTRDPPPHRRRSSRSPDFEADRRKERARYDSSTRSNRSNSERNPSSNEWGGNRQEQPQQQQTEEVDDEPDFGTSGLLAAASNSKNGVALKYHEPPEARLPKKKWRLYVFKDGKEVDLFHLSRQSCYLFGRDRSVCDIPVDHPSLSKQHLVLQFRSITTTNEFGDSKRFTKPYLIDLESSNGTVVNGKEIETSRYWELKNGDTFKLGASEREYVLLEEK